MLGVHFLECWKYRCRRVGCIAGAIDDAADFMESCLIGGDVNGVG